jgi:hypothetical protein
MLTLQLKIRGPITVEKVANGHLCLSMRNRGLFNILFLRFKLQIQHGFCRKGAHVILPDEGIGPDYIRGKIHLETGYDNCTGLYILSSDNEGDKFITMLHKELA